MCAKKNGPGDKGFVLDDYALYNLNRTAATYNDEMSKALKDYSLDTTQWRVLMLLEDGGPTSVGDIARKSVTKMPTVTRMLTRMEEQGLIKRRAPTGDRRFVEIRMTAKARSTLKKVQQIGQGVFERAFDGIDGAGVDRITMTLKQIRENLNRSPYDARRISKTK